jgi:hypothetical protein
MSEDEPNVTAPERRAEEQPTIEDYNKLSDDYTDLGVLWMRELERGKRTVIGLILEADHRLTELAGRRNPDNPDAPVGRRHYATPAEWHDATLLLRDEGYEEAFAIGRLLNESLNLLGATGSNIKEFYGMSDDE